MENHHLLREYPNPDRLKMGRRLRGMTQRELALAANVDQALISKYENGHVIPDEDLATIAQALKLPKVFFYRQYQVHAPNGTSMMLFRRRKGTPVKVRDQVIEEMNRLSENTHILFDSVDVQLMAELPDHRPETGAMEEIEDIADRARLELRIPPGPVRSMTRVLESIGVVISFRKLPPNVDALVDSIGGKPLNLVVSADILGGRLRFTLAHELGHLVMHSALNWSYDEIEEQANRFASAFLMPAQEIKARLRNLTMERLVALSAEWKVSVQALVRRAFDLDVISEWQYKSWNKQLTISGYRTAEPVPIPKETPTLLTSLIRIHINDLRYTHRELSIALAMEEWEFRRDYLGEPPLQVIPKTEKPMLRPTLNG